MDPRFDNEEVEAFKSSVGRKESSKGHRLFARGGVLTVAAVPDNPRAYAATVADAGSLHHVTLEYVEDLGWSSECDCDVECDCRHGMAALQAARQRAATIAPDRRANRTSASAYLRRRSKPAFVSSPLSQALEKALGRPLKPAEADYVTAIRGLWEAAGHGYVTGWHLAEIIELPGHSWDRVDLCPERPRDDLECWQYLAHIFRQNGRPIPEFLAPVTDTARVEAGLREWEKQKELARWRKLVEDATERTPEAARQELTADLRLRFGSAQVDVEWRSDGEEPFRKCRQKDLEDIREAYCAQELSCSPETERLLMMSLSAMGGNALDYEGDSQVLSRILNASGVASLTVGASGRPLARPNERLRLECIPPESGDGYYTLRLALPDGSVPPAFAGIVPGRRECHYLTADAVYKGPPHHGLGDDAEVRIPATVIESADGYRFLRSRGIPIPPRVDELVRVVRMTPTVACSIAERAGYRPTREFRLKLTATAPGTPRAEFRSWDWVAARDAGRPDRDGRTLVLDDELMQTVSASLDRLDVKWDEELKILYRRWPKSYPDWLVNWIRSLPEGVTLDLDAEIRSLLDDPLTARLRIEMQEAEIDWFDVKVVMDVSDTTLTREELALLMKAAGTPVFLPRLGAWKRMKTAWTGDDETSMARIGLSPADLDGASHRVHVLQLADAAAARLLPSDNVEKIRRRIDELKTRVTPPLPPAIRAQLRPYQTDGFHFLAYLAENRFGGVLADDMGLGKTLQALCWLAWLHAAKAPVEGIPPSAVICPKSVMENWRSEAERFYPSLRVTLWSPVAGADFAAVRRDSDLVVMNYTQLRLLDPASLTSPWFAAVLDEAQGIKNPNSLTAQAARAVVASYRLALTGTPIENRLMDLWSIMAFAMPGALGNRSLFAKRFASREDPLARGRLAARVRPFLIRRTKEEVAKDLPERTEEDIVCEMEGQQATLYQAELKRAQQLLLGVETQAAFNKERFNFLTSLLRLRQICCHPALLGGHAGVESAKLGALFDLVEPLMDEGHKVLVFSQFVRMLALIEKRIEERGWPRFLLTGDTEDRGALVRAFQAHDGAAVFLLSLKAGGFGLNLTAANYVVLYDPWWNPAVERQAIDRTHRIGQTNPVNAYRLIAKHSIEQKIRLLQQKKSALAEAVLGDERFGEALSLDDLRFILQD
ncbi:MAG: DEAD/DEAH box helicase [Lentisphaerae bacterium]|nr:DEAD/DEAH box helicase [Lentisphaerota bacterium]